MKFGCVNSKFIYGNLNRMCRSPIYVTEHFTNYEHIYVRHSGLGWGHTKWAREMLDIGVWCFLKKQIRHSFFLGFYLWGAAIESNPTHWNAIWHQPLDECVPLHEIIDICAEHWTEDKVKVDIFNCLNEQYSMHNAHKSRNNWQLFNIHKSPSRQQMEKS